MNKKDILLALLCGIIAGLVVAAIMHKVNVAIVTYRQE